VSGMRFHKNTNSLFVAFDELLDFIDNELISTFLAPKK
jgi:hypothetical protein